MGSEAVTTSSLLSQSWEKKFTNFSNHRTDRNWATVLLTLSGGMHRIDKGYFLEYPVE